MRKPDRPKPSQIFRCAIYTRKSSEDGLKQEFNSLDAQREACYWGCPRVARSQCPLARCGSAQTKRSTSDNSKMALRDAAPLRAPQPCLWGL
jgi:hypothetical protein